MYIESRKRFFKIVSENTEEMFLCKGNEQWYLGNNVDNVKTITS